MYGCVGAEAVQLQEKYKSLVKQSGVIATDKKCDRGPEDYEKSHTVLAELKQRADHLSQYSADTLSTCIKQWTTWLEAISKTGNDKIDPKAGAVVSATVADIINDQKNNLEGVVNMQTSAQKTIGSINDGLVNIEAGLIRSMLSCN
jgi:hypothetical protein